MTQWKHVSSAPIIVCGGDEVIEKIFAATNYVTYWQNGGRRSNYTAIPVQHIGTYIVCARLTPKHVTYNIKHWLYNMLDMNAHTHACTACNIVTANHYVRGSKELTVVMNWACSPVGVVSGPMGVVNGRSTATRLECSAETSYCDNTIPFVNCRDKPLITKCTQYQRKMLLTQFGTILARKLISATDVTWQCANIS